MTTPVSAVPKRIDVEVSYAARLGCAFTAAAVLGLYALWGVWVSVTRVPPADVPQPAHDLPLVLLPFIALAALFGGIGVKLLAERSGTPRSIDAAGVTMRDGAVLPWRDFQGVQAITSYNRRTLHHYEVGVELRFARRKVVVMYQALTNPAEVMWLTSELTSGRNPFIDAHSG